MAVVVPKAAYIVGKNEKKQNKHKFDLAVFRTRDCAAVTWATVALGGVYLVRANRTSVSGSVYFVRVGAWAHRNCQRDKTWESGSTGECHLVHTDWCALSDNYVFRERGGKYTGKRFSMEVQVDKGMSRFRTRRSLVWIHGVCSLLRHSLRRETCCWMRKNIK